MQEKKVTEATELVAKCLLEYCEKKCRRSIKRCSGCKLEEARAANLAAHRAATLDA